MNNRIFVDTAAWLALLNKRDSYHERARIVAADLARQNVRFLTTEFVFIEVADAFSSTQLRGVAINFVNQARQRPDLTILPLSEELLQAGWQLFSQRPDKDWGLTDCISFAAMTRENLTRAFTSDAHFAQAGFEKLL